MTVHVTKPRILFVDDEPLMLRGLANLLRKQRHRWDMEFAGSAEAALALLGGRAFDVIVSDARMPNVDGNTLLLQVRNEYPHMARILLSGYEDALRIADASALAHECIAKPCSRDELVAALDRAAELARIGNGARQ
jgi:DNA-binding NtrC family response regulator